MYRDILLEALVAAKAERQTRQAGNTVNEWYKDTAPTQLELLTIIAVLLDFAVQNRQ